MLCSFMVLGFVVGMHMIPKYQYNQDQSDNLVFEKYNNY